MSDPDTLQSLQFKPERYDVQSPKVRFDKYDPARYLVKASPRFEFSPSARARQRAANDTTPREPKKGRPAAEHPLRANRKESFDTKPTRSKHQSSEVSVHWAVSSASSDSADADVVVPVMPKRSALKPSNRSDTESAPRPKARPIVPPPEGRKRAMSTDKTLRSLATRAIQRNEEEQRMLEKAIAWGREQKAKEDKLIAEVEEKDTEMQKKLRVVRMYAAFVALMEMPVYFIYLAACLLGPFIRGLICDVTLGICAFLLTPRRRSEMGRLRRLLSVVGVVAGISIFNNVTHLFDGIVMVSSKANEYTCRCGLTYHEVCLGIERYLPFCHLLYVPVLLILVRQKQKLDSVLMRCDEVTFALQTLREQRFQQESAMLTNGQDEAVDSWL